MQIAQGLRYLSLGQSVILNVSIFVPIWYIHMIHQQPFLHKIPLLAIFYLNLDLSDQRMRKWLSWPGFWCYLTVCLIHLGHNTMEVNGVLFCIEKLHFKTSPFHLHHPQTWLWTVFIGTTSYWRNSPHKNMLTVRSVNGTENTLCWQCGEAN